MKQNVEAKFYTDVWNKSGWMQKIMADDLTARILKANVNVHHYESKYYELLHADIYNRFEQARLFSWLKLISTTSNSNDKKALDFGAGTGNLTSKLLKLDYTVTAIDISPEMCIILGHKYKKYVDSKKLNIINKPIEDANLAKSEFDLACCYSVLHHLPDYIGAIKKLSTLLKKGGIMYIDHEASPFNWSDSNLNQKFKQFFIFSNRCINKQYWKMMGWQIPPSTNLNYQLSDYWAFDERHIDHEKIETVLKEENFDFSARIDYHGHYTWIFNPLSYVYKHICKPEKSCWIARK